MVLLISKSLCSSLRRSWPRYSNPGYSFFSTSNQLSPFHQSTLTSTQGTSVFDYLVNHHVLPFSPAIAQKASHRAPSEYRVDHRYADSVLSYLTEVGFSRAQIETIVRRSPLILDADKVLKAKLEAFLNSGIEIEATRKIFTRDPSIILSSSRIAPTIEELKSVVGSVANVSALLQRSTWFRILNKDAIRVRTVEFVRSLGYTDEELMRFMARVPRVFVRYKLELVKKCTRMVEAMGFDRHWTKFPEAVSVVCTREFLYPAWEDRLKMLRELGFTDEDILCAFKREPRAFSAPNFTMKEAVEFLVSEAGVEKETIVRYPRLLKYCLDTRLKPWLEVIKILEKKKLLPDGGRVPDMATVYRMGKYAFGNKYVYPYFDHLWDTSITDFGCHI